MKTRSTILSALLLQATLSNAQTPLPYYTGFDNAAQTAGWQEFRKGNADPNYKWMYASFTAYSAPASLFHHYPVGGTVMTDDWFVSPGFSIPSGGRVDSIRSAFAGFGVPGTADTVALYLLKGSPDPALATSKTLLLDYRGVDYTNNDTWTAHSFPLASATGTCYLAVRYKTVNNWLDVKFDNLKISSSSSTSIHDEALHRDAIVLYPNPASQSLQIRFDQQAAVPVLLKLYTALGELLLEQKVKEQESLPLNLKNGTYFYTIVTGDGELFKSGKLMVENL